MEQFFLEALEQIKEEIRKKAQIEKKMRKHGQDTTAGAGDDKAGATNANGEKVDLNDLEWEDRERVLRLLFSKMNAGVMPTALIQRAAQKKQVQRQHDMQ